MTKIKSVPVFAQKPILGVVGGGQLARMMVPVATELDVDLRLMVEDFAGSAGSVWQRSFVGQPKNVDDMRRLAYGLDGKDVEKVTALTFEHEHIPSAVIEQIESEGFNVTPSSKALIFAQNKLKMREKMASLKLPQPDYSKVKNATSVMEFAKKHGGCVLKAATGGYDGKGVWFIDDKNDIPEFDKDIDYIVEQKVQFVREVSQLVVRSSNGELAAYPLVESRQLNGVCKTVIAPAPELKNVDDSKIKKNAEEIALTIAEKLGVVGVLAVEMFQKNDGSLLINELAMRPHNTGHWTVNGAVTSQFENHIRACLGLPLGSTKSTSEITVMENILGSTLNSLSEQTGNVLNIDSRLKVNLYGKGIREGRKLGHVNISGKKEEVDNLLKLAKQAADCFENNKK